MLACASADRAVCPSSGFCKRGNIFPLSGLPDLTELKSWVNAFLSVRSNASCEYRVQCRKHTAFLAQTLHLFNMQILSRDWQGLQKT